MPNAFSKVLVVTDFSETGNNAVSYAYALAGPSAEVHLLHLIAHEDSPNPLYAHYTPDDLMIPEKRKKLMADIETHLRKLVPKDAKVARTVCGVGFHRDIPEGIVDEAQARGAEVIVVGSHGRTGLLHLVMGSVTEQVLRNSPVPVLVVPPPES